MVAQGLVVIVSLLVVGSRKLVNGVRRYRLRAENGADE
jgi:hypothetical protein